MKTLNKINYYVVGIPVTMCLIGYLFKNILGMLLFFGALFTMITGAYQLIIGIYLFLKDKQNINLQVYLISVILFFSFWYWNTHVKYVEAMTYILIIIPVILCIFFSNILYKKSKI